MPCTVVIAVRFVVFRKCAYTRLPSGVTCFAIPVDVEAEHVEQLPDNVCCVESTIGISVSATESLQMRASIYMPIVKAGNVIQLDQCRVAFVPECDVQVLLNEATDYAFDEIKPVSSTLHST